MARPKGLRRRLDGAAPRRGEEGRPRGDSDGAERGDLGEPDGKRARAPARPKSLRAGLAALELRRPLLEEGGDAFPEVLGSRRGGLELRLALELLLQSRGVRVVEQALRQGDAARRQR